ncbi:unnamed protein product, partial [Rhizoctonia solani]
ALLLIVLWYIHSKNAMPEWPNSPIRLETPWDTHTPKRPDTRKCTQATNLNPRRASSARDVRSRVPVCALPLTTTQPPCPTSQVSPQLVTYAMSMNTGYQLEPGRRIGLPLTQLLCELPTRQFTFVDVQHTPIDRERGLDSTIVPVSNRPMIPGWPSHSSLFRLQLRGPNAHQFATHHRPSQRVPRILTPAVAREAYLLVSHRRETTWAEVELH